MFAGLYWRWSHSTGEPAMALPAIIISAIGIGIAAIIALRTKWTSDQ